MIYFQSKSYHRAFMSASLTAWPEHTYQTSQVNRCMQKLQLGNFASLKGEDK